RAKRRRRRRRSLPMPGDGNGKHPHRPFTEFTFRSARIRRQAALLYPFALAKRGLRHGEASDGPLDFWGKQPSRRLPEKKYGWNRRPYRHSPPDGRHAQRGCIRLNLQACRVTYFFFFVFFAMAWTPL